MSIEPTHRYDDIIDMPHHQSKRHRLMAMEQRAAQFMPFAALAGYEDLLRGDGQGAPAAYRIG